MVGTFINFGGLGSVQNKNHEKGGSILSHARLIISILRFFNSFLASTFLLARLLLRLLLLLLVCRRKVDYVCSKIGAKLVRWCIGYFFILYSFMEKHTHPSGWVWDKCGFSSMKKSSFLISFLSPFCLVPLSFQCAFWELFSLRKNCCRFLCIISICKKKERESEKERESWILLALLLLIILTPQHTYMFVPP